MAQRLDHPARNCSCDTHQKWREQNKKQQRKRRGYYETRVYPSGKDPRVGACFCGRGVGEHDSLEWIYGCGRMVRG